MPKTVLKLLSGYMCNVLLSGVIYVNCQNDCTVFNQHPVAVRCANKKMTEIPQDLDTNIQHLELPDCHFQKLPDYSFRRYTNLISLNMERTVLDNLDNIDLDLFEPLKNLKVLNLESSNLAVKYYFYWPPSLAALKVSNTNVQHLGLSHLLDLEQLDANHTKITEFPIFNKYAPLRHINIDGNQIISLSAERLAPFCLLSQLGMNFPPESPLLKEKIRYCLCSRINVWTRMVEMNATVLKCTPPKPDYKCDTEFADERLVMRRECLARANTLSRIFTYLLIIVGILLLIAGSVVIWRLYNQRKEKSSSVPVNDVQKNENLSEE